MDHLAGGSGDEDIPAVAAGWNDRIVIVEWEAPGGRRSNVVWRNAVMRRQASP